MKYILLPLFFFCMKTSFTQDTIYLIPIKHRGSLHTSDLPEKEPSFGPKKIPYRNRSGDTVVIAKIIKEASLQIVFLRHNTTAPVYTLRKNEIQKIKFEDGRLETFPEYERKREEASVKKKRLIPEHQNQIIAGLGGFTFSIPFFGNRQDAVPVFHAFIGYEKLFWGGRFGAALTPFVGFNKGAYGSSLTIKHYTKSSEKFRISFGPSIMWSQQNYTEILGSWRSGDYDKYKYRTSLFIISANLSIQKNMKNNYFTAFDVNLGKLMANSKEKTHTDKGQLMMRLGVGKRF